MAKRGDTRIMAEWCNRVPVDEYGESNWDAAEYETYGPFATPEEAARHAEDNDLFSEGHVVVERYAEVLPNLYQWEEEERYNTWELEE